MLNVEPWFKEIRTHEIIETKVFNENGIIADIAKEDNEIFIFLFTKDCEKIGFIHAPKEKKNKYEIIKQIFDSLTSKTAEYELNKSIENINKLMESLFTNKLIKSPFIKAA